MVRAKNQFCGTCPNAYFNRADLERHMAKVHGEGNGPVQILYCSHPGCQHICDSRSNMRRHELEHERRVWRFVCMACRGTKRGSFGARKTELRKRHIAQCPLLFGRAVNNQMVHENQTKEQLEFIQELFRSEVQLRGEQAAAHLAFVAAPPAQGVVLAAAPALPVAQVLIDPNLFNNDFDDVFNAQPMDESALPRMGFGQQLPPLAQDVHTPADEVVHPTEAEPWVPCSDQALYSHLVRGTDAMQTQEVIESKPTLADWEEDFFNLFPNINACDVLNCEDADAEQQA